MNMLNLGQQRPLIRRELSRRIGYTNGLHDIFRFSRTVGYLHKIAPASVPALRAVVLDEEGVSGAKYADGVIEVAGALGLVVKTGAKLTLADKGYALHALGQMDHPEEPQRALLLNAVLESDGDATLNLLDLIAKNTPPKSLGPLLIQRLFAVIQLREEWATKHVADNLARELVLQDLSDARARLQRAVDLDRKQTRFSQSSREGRGLSPGQRVARFYDHTVQPRRGWLRDLGCLVQKGRGIYETTESGLRLLEFLRDAIGPDSALALPFSSEVLGLLGVDRPRHSEDVIWRATAVYFGDSHPVQSLSSEECFQFILGVYPHVKLHVFNEATVESIYDVMAAKRAVAAVHLPRYVFDQELDSVCREFPERIFRLRQRQGGSGYVAVRSALG